MLFVKDFFLYENFSYSKLFEEVSYGIYFFRFLKSFSVDIYLFRVNNGSIHVWNIHENQCVKYVKS